MVGAGERGEIGCMGLQADGPTVPVHKPGALPPRNAFTLPTRMCLERVVRL